MKRACLVLLLFLPLTGCGGDKNAREDARDLGQQTADITSDTNVLREASAAVNEVIRNAADCEAAKGAIAEANRKLDEAEGRVRTATGRTTLETLRKQVRTVAEACP